MIARRLLLGFLLLAPIAFAANATERERIHDFDAMIEIARDGTLTITETITVTVEGQKIERGIYRDFPTRYSGRGGTRVEVPFAVVRVRRNGGPEAFHTQDVAGGIRVYMGRRSEKLPHGLHRYELTYTTRKQLGFFEEHDELYWNVTGNFWDFEIERARARVRLPGSVSASELSAEGYTGPAGAKGRDLQSKVDPGSGELRFETTAALPRHHGLTIVARFPKGLVTPPSPDEARRDFLEANAALVAGLIGVAVVLGYYLLAWIAVGRDPARGTILPRFEPPSGMSPAAMRHLMRMGYDHECFSTALVSMAVKGVLRIEEKGGEYTLVRSDGDRKRLSPGERRIADRLIPSGRFAIDRSDHAKISAAVAVFRKWLKLEHEGALFRANRAAFVPGLVISALALLAIASRLKGDPVGGAQGPPVLFLMAWVTVWSLGVYGLLAKVRLGWRTAFGTPSGGGRATGLLGAIFITLFAAPFVAAEVVALAFLAQATSLAMIPTLLVLVLSNAVFYQLLKRPTSAGRGRMDEIDGFAMYLRAAEADDLRRLDGPKPTSELFERYLPYALALGLENEWAERFSEVLEQAGGGGERGYSPAWYSGRDFSGAGSQGLVSSLGSSLSGAIATYSAAPGSSSGGGGGGSSGGGGAGGGGGGGGW